MDWQRLITNKRLGQEHRHGLRHDDRSEFKRDYDRLIFSPSAKASTLRSLQHDLTTM